MCFARIVRYGGVACVAQQLIRRRLARHVPRRPARGVSKQCCVCYAVCGAESENTACAGCIATTIA